MEHLRQLIHGGDLVTCKEQHPSLDFIDFSANINPLGLPDGVRAALMQCADCCTRYPDQLCREWRAALAQFEGVPADWILCGNGAADIIYRIAYALRPRQALLLAPTFAEYEQAMLQVGCALRLHTLSPDNNFAVKEDYLDKIPGCDVVFLCNPNNPTGKLMGPELLQRISDACKKANAILVVDECFLEFLPDSERYSLKRDLGSFGGLIVLRAFTKIFAMPGLRLGYALCSNKKLLGKIDRAGAPWSVSVPAQLCGIAAAKERRYLAESRALVERERVYLQQGLATLGFQVFESAVNYILFYTSNANLAAELCAKGIVLRDCSNYRGLSPGYFRTAVRTRGENSALLNAIKEL